jgi:hypothetical protein
MTGKPGNPLDGEGHWAGTACGILRVNNAVLTIGRIVLLSPPTPIMKCSVSLACAEGAQHRCRGNRQR